MAPAPIALRPRPSGRDDSTLSLPASPSSPSFPLFARLTSISFSSSAHPSVVSTTTTTTDKTKAKPTRDRRISLGGLVPPRTTRKVPHRTSMDDNRVSVAAPGPLKRSKSARLSLVSAATRRFNISFSSATTTAEKTTRNISHPVLQPSPTDGDDDAFLSDRYPLSSAQARFAMSSPELGLCDDEEEEDGTQVSPPPPPPTSPMVKWRKDAGPSFAPLAPPRPPRAISPMRHLSITDESATREANRQAALAKLTQPTPSPSSARFPDDDAEFDAFPFPRVPTPRASSPTTSSAPPPLSTSIEVENPPPRPSRRPPPVPTSTIGGSQSLIVASPSTPLSAPRLPRSNTVSLHPSPSIALDIDFRGRLLRARNSHHSPSSPSPAVVSATPPLPRPPRPLPSSNSIGSDSCCSSSSSSCSSCAIAGGGGGGGGSSLSNFSPRSSRFNHSNDHHGYPYCHSSSRRSSETSLSLSINPPTPERDPVAAVSTSTCTSNKKGGGEFYAIADRRLAESAVDVLAIVEEDEAAASSTSRPTMTIPTRLGGRAPSVKRASSSGGGGVGGGGAAKSSVSPSRRHSSGSKRLSLERTLSSPSPSSSPSSSSLRLSTGAGGPSSEVVRVVSVRTRRPAVDSATAAIQAPSTSTSSSSVEIKSARDDASREVTRFGPPPDQDESGSGFSIGTGVRGAGARVNFVERSNSTTTMTMTRRTEQVPFPSNVKGDGVVEYEKSAVAPPPRRPHRRANSDLHVVAAHRSISPPPPLGPSRGSRGTLESGGRIGLGFPPPPAPAQLETRSRQESYSPEVEPTATTGEALLEARKTSRRSSGQHATRTKLVLREKGKPTLTYQLGECIGRGQFGTVYRALNLNSGQVVAVKRIQLEGKTEHEIRELSNEVSLLQRLNHPAIVRYQGLLRSENYLNIILEYAESGSLQTTLRQFGQLPEGLVASYVVKILEGLAYLHEQGVVHCDLKAANILSTKTGNTKLSDFGVSLNLHAIKNTTQGFGGATKDVQGTPNWMSPECISLQGAVPASDIWSLGCTIVELVDGRPPYADLVAMSAMFRIVEDEDGPPIPGSCSPELRAFLARCFRKNPKERPTAVELFEDPWLLQHFVPHQDLRPQDSIPFMRRVSGDYHQKARPSLEFPRAMSPIANTRTESPLAIEPCQSPTQVDALPFGQEGEGKRDSIDLHSPVLSSFAHATEETPNPHDWIRSSFSRAVMCKLCGDSTKRHAVLCSQCGLVAHRRCTEFAPSCDLRAQLLGPKVPLYPAATVSSFAPAPAPAASSSFSLTDYLPGFSRSRRPKPRPTSSSDQSVVPSSSPPPLPPSSGGGGGGGGVMRPSTTAAKRRLSNVIPSNHHHHKPRHSPDPTPPNSLTRAYGVFVGAGGRNRSSTSVVTTTRRNENGSSGDSSIIFLNADDLAPPPPPSNDDDATTSSSPPGIRRKLSNNVVVQTALNAGRLDRKKSSSTHARTQSQPVNKVKTTDSSDCVIS